MKLYLVWCNDDLLAILPEHKGQEAVDFLEKQKVRQGGGFTRTPYRDDDPIVQRWSNGGSVPRLSIEKEETK